MNNYLQIAALVEQNIDDATVMMLTNIKADELALVKANMKLECNMKAVGAENYKERQDDLLKRGKDMETDNNTHKINKMLKPMIKALDEIVLKAVNVKKKGIVVNILNKYKHDYLALLTLRTCMFSLITDKLELAAMSIRLTENLIDEDLTKPEQLRVGMKLIDVFCKNSDDCFIRTKRSNGVHAVHVLGVTEKFIKWEIEHRDMMAELTVVYRPMVVAPQPWSSFSRGGYWDNSLRHTFVRHHPKANNKTHGPKAIPRVYEAVNKIQATPFTINKFVLGVANELNTVCVNYLDDVEKNYNHVPKEFSDKFLQSLPERPITGRVSQYQKQQAKLEEKLGITQAERTEHGKGFGKWVRDLLSKILPDTKEAKIKAELEEVRFNIMQLVKWQKDVTSKSSKNRVVTMALEVANEYAQYPALYFPANVDWRGRVYPMCSGLTTQGVCLQKALIKFNKGKPIGSTKALYWLMVHTANSFGMDKASWQDRLEWTLANKEMIQRIAANPVENLEDWKHTDAPWLFLAACEQMQKYYDHGLDAVVDIPIPMDGTCNGAQHYALMSRDKQSAYQVNVAPNGTQGLLERIKKLRETNKTPVGFAEWKDFLIIEVNRKIKKLIGAE